MTNENFEKIKTLLTDANDEFFNQGLLLLENLDLTPEEAYTIFGIPTTVQSFFELAMCPQFIKSSFFPEPAFWSDTYRILHILGYFAKFGVEWASQLTSLVIPDCKVTALPNVMVYLSNLTTLSVNGDLSQIPTFVHNLPNLQELNLTNCKLDSFSSLQSTSLRHLKLAHNQITELPSDFSRIPALETLNISFNPIENITSIGQITNLLQLDISQTPVQYLPSSIGSCSKLTKLMAIKTPIGLLPDELQHCTKLEKLVLMGTQISQWPEALLALVNLKHIGLSGTPITALSWTVDAYPALTELLIDATNILSCPNRLHKDTFDILYTDSTQQDLFQDFINHSPRQTFWRTLDQVIDLLVENTANSFEQAFSLYQPDMAQQLLLRLSSPEQFYHSQPNNSILYGKCMLVNDTLLNGYPYEQGEEGEPKQVLVTTVAGRNDMWFQAFAHSTEHLAYVTLVLLGRYWFAKGFPFEFGFNFTPSQGSVGEFFINRTTKSIGPGYGTIPDDLCP